MLERFVQFIRSLPAPTQSTQEPYAHEVKIAAIALLIHVIEADGERSEAESDLLREQIAGVLHISRSETDRLVKAGTAAEREAVDLFGFTSVLVSALSEEQRLAFIGALWDIVYVDGDMHELEDNLVWRISELLGVDDRDRVQARLDARDRRLDDR
ncbi:TerB family tellurite resistance protein [Limoniibacter endophyticus]|uniref:Co-chaperone DjlA N-terminal domain-containing protein n=1 Tax=Limoniibacter endophyticus TaxID=1565040 RepID=A0A8J3DI39_9HYPH|nr:TerB family tellurite resistance protein [Limoniibacter endophyticus]GHC73945.1 hypothetical protein GCM10010136_22580 [Limoniibacter endophyticus]